MNRCESFNSVELNESKQKEHSVSHQYIKKLPDKQQRVETDCYVYASQSHQCNSRNIPEYDCSKGFYDSILENRKFTHRKQ